MRSRYSTGRASKRVKVAHRLTPYDYALRSVILDDTSGVTGECQNILEGEALMENTKNRAQYYATFRHVHSDQRAVAGQARPGVGRYRLRDKLEDLRFAGFAVTGYDSKHSVYEQGFMSTIGGVNTVINTGDKPLEAGQEVFVLPTDGNNDNQRIKGVHNMKQLFSTVHARHLADNNLPPNETGHYADALRAAYAIVSGNAAPADAAAYNGLNDDAGKKSAVDFLRKFAVGTCIRGGRKTQPVDIVLHANANILQV